VTDTLGFFDRRKINALTRMRYLNAASVERWSESTFRRARPLDSKMPTLVPARDHYETPAIPARMMVAGEMPDDAALPFRYTAPYYYLAGAAFKLLNVFPLDTGPEWTPELWFNDAFPANAEGWADALGDESFAQMRIQGANPFLLARDPAGDGRFIVDYAPYFDGIAPPVKCFFRVEKSGLVVDGITIDGDMMRPGADGWGRAKLLANGLDARYDVFTRHLLDTHLMVGQAYALSAYALPVEHPLRAFLDLFTYGTLAVNDFAYKLLITPASYFIRSNFITAADAFRLFDNSMDVFSLDDMSVPFDIAKRGIDRIPNHAYVQDATDAWSVFEGFVFDWVGRVYADDDAMRADGALQRWYAQLAALLPNRDITDSPLDGISTLVTVLCCLLQIQVVHEVCGDFSAYAAVRDRAHKKLVNFDRLLGRAPDAPPSAADVFLFQQGAFAGRFNNGGNNMLRLDANAHVSDPVLRDAVGRFQAKLRTLDETMTARNAKRARPFLRMQPSAWEMSISF